MNRIKINSYLLIVIAIVIIFAILPSVYVCYEKYQNLEEKGVREENIIKLCDEAIFPPNMKAYEWIFTIPGLMLISGIIVLIVTIIIYDMRHYHIIGIKKYKRNYAKYNEDEKRKLLK